MKAFQQLLFTFGPDTGNVVQFGVTQPLAAQLPVIRDSEAVDFLLDRADQRKDCLLGIDIDLLAVRGHQCPCAVSIVFDHAEYRNVYTKPMQSRQCRIGMSHATVDQQYIRLFLKALVPFHVMMESTCNHLTHGCIVILPGQPFKAETLVFAFLWLTVFKHHHAGNDICAGNVGNIKGFHSV